MMKDEFLARLAELLGDLPQEEREEAVRYYEDYFADAGPLEEARVLRELVSPEDVAEKIRAGCGAKSDEGDVSAEDIFEKRAKDGAVTPDLVRSQGNAMAQEGPLAQEGSWSQGNAVAQEEPLAQEGSWAQGNAVAQEGPLAQGEAGMQEGSWSQGNAMAQEGPVAQEEAEMQEEPLARGEVGMQEGPWSQGNAMAQEAPLMQEGPWGNAGAHEDARAQERRMRMNETYAQDYEDATGYAQEDRHSGTGDFGRGTYPRGATVRTKSYFSPVISILALVIGIPILCPIIFAFICMLGGLFIGFGIGGIGLVAGGVALISSALANISAGFGLLCLFSGGGLILAAIGILFIVFAVNCAFRAIPALFRGIRCIFRGIRGCRA